MSAPSSRSLLSLTLAFTLLAMFTLLLTAIAIERAEPEELAILFPSKPAPLDQPPGPASP